MVDFHIEVARARPRVLSRHSGLVVIARSDTRLDELACIDDLFVAVTDTIRADDWRIGFLDPEHDHVAVAFPVSGSTASGRGLRKR